MSTHRTELQSEPQSEPRSLSSKSRSQWPEWTAIALFASIVAYAIPFHEPWADEAQAWQMARSLPLWDLLTNYVRYEGSPGLWHALLWMLIQLRVSFTGLHWICGAIAVVSTSILVLKSPFPRWLKLALPFTNFLLFQYAVVARNYVLAPPMLFLVAVCWNGNPFLIAILLGLLANLSLHTAVISGGLAVVFFIERLRNWRSIPAGGRNKLILSAVTVCALYAFAIWTAWPPPDLLISRVRSATRPMLAEAVQSLTLGIAWPWVLPLLIWIGICICLGARRKLIYLLPVLFFALFSGALHFEWWHIGLVVPLVLAILWITWPASIARSSISEKIGSTAIACMVVVQIVWSIYAISYDHSNAYSPDLATATFLRPLIQNGAQVAVTHLGDEPEKHDYQAVGILPYFDRNIFINQPEFFWWWSEKNQTEHLFQSSLNSRPKIVVVEVRHLELIQHLDPQDPKVALLLRNGYQPTNLFCGKMPISLWLGLSDCHLIFQHSESEGKSNVHP